MAHMLFSTFIIVMLVILLMKLVLSLMVYNPVALMILLSILILTSAYYDFKSKKGFLK